MPVSNIVIGQKISRELQERARALRRNMTPAERILWEKLRHNRLNGFQFRRQQIIDTYIVDFYCHSKALIIEVDGDIHDLQQEYDEERDNHLRARGFRILRVSNQDVREELLTVLQKILEACLQF
jgi:very-short-patch-repair endonuclease